jgi:signal peptidase I
MSRVDKKILFILLITFFFLIANIIYGHLFNQYLYIGFWLIILTITIILIGFKKDKSVHKKDLLQQIFIYTFLYLILMYICGIFIGFLKSLNSFTLLNIIKNILPVLLYLILIELLRYTIVSKQPILLNKILMIIIFATFDFLFNINKFDLTLKTDILRIICTVILPSLATNVFLTYLTDIGGYLPCILYSLVTSLYVYIIPVIPDFGEYMTAVISTCIPLLFLLRFIKLYKKEKLEVVRNKRIKNKVFMIILIFITSIIVYLISDIFTFKAVTIGSGSMVPTLNIGDIAILIKITDYSTLKKNDILIHKHDKKTVIHRIVKVTYHDKHYYFQTKGDHNNANDNYLIEEKEVVGKYLFKVPYIGYPSVWLSNVIK